MIKSRNGLIKFADNNNDNVLVRRASIISGDEHTINICIDFNIFCAALKAWNDGVYIQDAFPMLSDDEREFLLSGITTTEWDNIFDDNNDCELNNPEVV